MSKNRDLGIFFKMQDVSAVRDIEYNEHGEISNTPFTLSGQEIDIEETFSGLTYASAEGLLTKGKIKNIYQETYADSNLVRTRFPQTPTREATTVKFTFAIVGESRYQVYENFYKYITSGIKSFYDSKRNRRLIFIASEEYSPAQELFYGSTPWLKIDIEVKNIFGETFAVNE